MSYIVGEAMSGKTGESPNEKDIFDKCVFLKAEVNDIFLFCGAPAATL